ncbi:MAG: hypothetical protein Tsb0013_07960 [Phycisphaerales bacterium]
MHEDRPQPEQTVGELTRLTSWALLLSHWTSWARHSVALPENPEGQAWRASVAPVIGLQAHVFALAELDRLPEDERALGLDRASAGIDAHERALRDAWAGRAMPEGVADLLIDARTALRAAEATQEP